MAVIRVEKRKGYTIISNYHLRDKNLSLKAKGLLSIMLSLPDDWHYNIRGLAAICKEGVTSISSTLKELEQCGYMRRYQPNDGGKFGEIEYIISETPQKEAFHGTTGQSDVSSVSSLSDASESVTGNKKCPRKDSTPFSASQENTGRQDDRSDSRSLSLEPSDSRSFRRPEGVKPCAASADTGFAYTDSAYTDYPCTENPYTVNTDTESTHTESADAEFADTDVSYTEVPDTNKIKSQEKTERQRTDQNNNLSIHPATDSALKGSSALSAGQRDTMDGMDMNDPRLLQQIGAKKLKEDYDAYRELVMANIAFDELVKAHPSDADTLRGILDIMVEAICSTAPTIRIGGQDIPQHVVKSRLLKLDSGHIDYAMTCFFQNTNRVRNIKSYLLTTLYNAPATMDAYFQNWVQSDYPELSRSW